MKTYFIGAEETRAYAKDFLRRLENLESFPEVWCPITKSGDAIASVLAGLDGGDLLAKVQLVPIAVAREAQDVAISFPEGDPQAQLAGKTVLLLDGAIHSGRTMSRCAEEVMKFKPQDVVSYSLVTKAGASFVPTIWGVTIDETDRAFFLLEEIPNHRLDAGNPSRKQPPVHVERLEQRHKDRPPVTSGIASMDRSKWSDRLFQMQVSTSCTYVLSRGATIVGYLTIHFSNESMFIDEVAIDEGQKKRGYGGVLMRFADTLARQGNCRTVILNAIDSEVGFYEKLDYRKVAPSTPILLDNEAYWPMQRSVLYHQRPK